MNKVNQPKRAYHQVDLWKRKDLIETITRKDETMKVAAKRLGINYCTAKHIMKVFRRSGSHETDLMRKKKRMKFEMREKVLNDSQFSDYLQIKNMTQTQGYAPATIFNRDENIRNTSIEENKEDLLENL